MTKEISININLFISFCNNFIFSNGINIQIYIFYFLTFISELKAQKEEILWQKCLFNYIKNESGVHETIFFIDDKQTLPQTIDNFVKNIYKSLPVKIFNNNLKMISSMSNFSSDSSLFIAITFFQQNNNFNKFTNLVTSIAKNKKRPKLLMIIYKRTTSNNNNSKLTYHKVLQSMWLDLILDATLIEVSSVELKLKKKSINNLRNESTLMYYYNPYLNMTTESNITLNTVWFPKKTKNLNEYSINVGFLNYPPEIILKLNKSGHINSLNGFSAHKMTTLSQIMNFRLEKSFISNWGTLSCTMKNVQGFYRKLLNNEIHAAAVEHPRYSLCDNKYFEFSKGTKIISISLVVPEIIKTAEPTHSWKILDGLAVIGLVAFMWIVSHLLNFDLREWHAIYMIQLVLNTATPHKPTKIEERIVFASMMWACFFHSSYIYMSFTDFSLNTEGTSMFQSVQNVLESELEIIIDNNYADMLYNNSDGNIRKLLNKANKMTITEEECITQMVTNKNLSCVAREDHARFIIGNLRDKCGKQFMKILDETLWVFVSSTYLAPASPYVKRFDSIIQRFIETGVEKKWQIVPSNSSDFINEDDVACASNKSKLDHELNNLLIILGFGYITCTTIFIAEILMQVLLKNFNNRCLVTISQMFH